VDICAHNTRDFFTPARAAGTPLHTCYRGRSVQSTSVVNVRLYLGVAASHVARLLINGNTLRASRFMQNTRTASENRGTTSSPFSCVSLATMPSLLARATATISVRPTACRCHLQPTLAVLVGVRGGALLTAMERTAAAAAELAGQALRGRRVRPLTTRTLLCPRRQRETARHGSSSQTTLWRPFLGSSGAAASWPSCCWKHGRSRAACYNTATVVGVPAQQEARKRRRPRSALAACA
jgi:hypothetical protein